MWRYARPDVTWPWSGHVTPPGYGERSGKNKSDIIDADVLAMASDVFNLAPLRPPSPPQLALRRAVVRRGKLVIDGNRARRRLISLARWAFPDVWQGFAGSWPTAVAVLTRWPDLPALACARRSSVSNVVAAHTRGVPDVDARAERIRAAAARTVTFWDGHLDLDALAWETSEHLRDITIAAEQIGRATVHAHQYWASLYGDDPLLLSLPGMGPMTAPTVRAFFGDATAFPTAKAAAAYVGLTASTWSSGTVVQPSRAITKEGRPCCGWRSTRPPAAPAASTPSSPPTTDTSWSNAVTATPKPTSRSPASSSNGPGPS